MSQRVFFISYVWQNTCCDIIDWGVASRAISLKVWTCREQRSSIIWCSVGFLYSVCRFYLNADLHCSAIPLLCIWIMLFKLRGCWRMECKTSWEKQERIQTTTASLSSLLWFWMQKYVEWVVYFVSVTDVQQPADICLLYRASGKMKYYTRTFLNRIFNAEIHRCWAFPPEMYSCRGGKALWLCI